MPDARRRHDGSISNAQLPLLLALSELAQMNHRGKSSGGTLSLEVRENDDAESKSKSTSKRALWQSVTHLRRYRCWMLLLPLVFVLGMLLERHYKEVLPRVHRRRRNRQTKVIVPFPTDGDDYLNEYSVSVQPILKSDISIEAKNNSQWEWFCYSSLNSSAAGGPRVLMAQYAGFSEPNGHYSSLLQTSSPVNRAYAKEWGMDYVTLKGIGLDALNVLPSEYFLPRHSTYNKLELLRKGLELSHQYDWIWILDADALVYNLSTSFSSILPSPKANDSIFLLAHRVHPEDSLHAYNVNIGVLIFNLHHPTTPQLLSNWTRHSLNRIAANAQLRNLGKEDVLLDNCDQSIMQHILKDLTDRTGIYAMPDLQEKVVKHVLRGHVSIWDKHSPDREAVLKQLANDICQRYAPACVGMNEEKPSKSSSSSGLSPCTFAA